MNKLFFYFFILINTGIVFSQKELTHEVYFDTDKYALPPTEENRLLLFISKIADIEIGTISIYGFCDDVGADSYNLALSQKRAEAIKEIFSENEISENLITNVDGKGEVLLKIINEKDVSKIRGLNRKVEIVLIAKTEEEKRLEALSLEEKESAQEKLKQDLKTGDKIRLENILFKTGYALLTHESKSVLKEIAEVLLKRDDIYFTIQGHVCCTQYSRDAIDRKTKQRNLSQARAKLIYEYFAKEGIETKRMKYVGLRRLFPLGEDPKYDRRVEILITYAGGKPYVNAD